MLHTIYVEKEVLRHPRTIEIRGRLPQARVVECDRYGEIFNRRRQSFRLQKRSPSLILAAKHGNRVLDAPDGYGVGGARNYYFSHMLNCPYDCRYCFLQGMFRSAHHVVFVNYEDFAADLEERVGDQGESWFFSGYDCDSLAFDGVTGFADYFLELFSRHPRARLELRTKSARIDALLERPALPNVVVAFSFTPEEVRQVYEHRVPPLERRLRAMARLQDRGWKLGLRFDPLIYEEDFEIHYRALFQAVFAVVSPSSLHSVSLGSFRLPRDFYRRMVRLYPEEPLFGAPATEAGGMVSYSAERNHEMLEFCSREVLRYIPDDILFPCLSGAEAS